MELGLLLMAANIGFILGGWFMSDGYKRQAVEEGFISFGTTVYKITRLKDFKEK